MITFIRSGWTILTIWVTGVAQGSDLNERKGLVERTSHRQVPTWELDDTYPVLSGKWYKKRKGQGNGRKVMDPGGRYMYFVG